MEQCIFPVVKILRLQANPQKQQNYQASKIFKYMPSILEQNYVLIKMALSIVP